MTFVKGVVALGVYLTSGVISSSISTVANSAPPSLQPVQVPATSTNTVTEAPVPVVVVDIAPSNNGSTTLTSAPSAQPSAVDANANITDEKVLDDLFNLKGSESNSASGSISASESASGSGDGIDSNSSSPVPSRESSATTYHAGMKVWMITIVVAIGVACFF
jgi:hypothetical protein